MGEDIYFRIFIADSEYGIEEKVNLWIATEAPIILETHMSSSMCVKDNEVIHEYCFSALFTESFLAEVDIEEEDDED